MVVPEHMLVRRVAFLGYVAKQQKQCSVPNMAMFTIYGHTIIPHGH